MAAATHKFEFKFKFETLNHDRSNYKFIKLLLKMQSDDLKFPLKPKLRTRIRKDAKNKQVAFHHTYVMKLYDRSVDLAQFHEDTPLYPICRAWMANKPKVSQTSVTKTRITTPEPLSDSDSQEDGISALPKPDSEAVCRIPSPIPEQLDRHLDKIVFTNDNAKLPEKGELMEKHIKRWAKIRSKWIDVANKNEERFIESTNILNAIFKKIT